MITFIKGTVYAYDYESVIIDNHGIGYKVYFNTSSPLVLGQEVLLHTYHQFLEDGQNLYGFTNRDDLLLFEKLISVKGLGPKTAMKAFGSTNYTSLIAAIERSDVDFLKHLPGIGKATASQIVLDLKGKLVSKDDNTVTSSELLDAIEALKTLGYKNTEIQSITKTLKESGLSTSDEYLKLALQLMGGRK